MLTQKLLLFCVCLLDSIINVCVIIYLVLEYHLRYYLQVGMKHCIFSKFAHVYDRCFKVSSKFIKLYLVCCL